MAKKKKVKKKVAKKKTSSKKKASKTSKVSKKKKSKKVKVALTVNDEHVGTTEVDLDDVDFVEADEDDGQLELPENQDDEEPILA